MAHLTDSKNLLELMKMPTLLGEDIFAKEYLTDFNSQEMHVNTKTVFANPLAIMVRIDDLASALASTGNDHKMRQLHAAREKLYRTVANETKCSGCSHMDVHVEDNRNLSTGVVDYRLRTICKQAKSSATTAVICPDGDITAKDGQVSQRMVEPMVYLPPPEQSKPDRPTTNSGDTAW